MEQECFSLPWTETALRNGLNSGSLLLLVAVRGAEVLGYAGLQYVLDEGYITNVCTAPGCRRKGIAAALLNEMQHRAEQMRLAFLTLELRVSNTAAYSLYEKQGYRAVGIRPGYYEQPREDAVIMTLYLSNPQNT